MNKPFEISLAEWEEIMQVPIVKETWNADEELTAAELASCIYGVKFNFTEIGRFGGYQGDLFLLLEADVTAPVIRLGRIDGRLAQIFGKRV